MEPIKTKVIVTIVIILFGSIAAVLFTSNSTVTAYQSTGIAIDFGNRSVVWTDVDIKEKGDPIEALEYSCNENDFSLTIDPDGNVTEIGGIQNDSSRTWGLWVVHEGYQDWTKLNEYCDDISPYSVTSWAFCSGEETPTVGVDQYGRCIYGYAQATKVVTLSPSLTEIIGSLNAVSTLVGTDKYSDYPDAVVTAQNKGDITIVGDFLSPSFELIMKSNPDVVFCDGSQYAHYELAEKIRKTNVNSVILYSGESIDTILDNIYIMGVVIGYEQRARDVVSSLMTAEKDIFNFVASGSTVPKDTLLSLSAEKSPWVSGSFTYFSDILETVLGVNVFSSRYGWSQVNSEMIAQSNPSVVIIVTEEYAATESEYQALLNSMSEEWRKTDAWKNGNIYVLCEGAADLAQMAGPRYAQLMELTALMLHPGSLPTTITIPKYVGNDYESYLEFTKYLSFN